MIWDAEKETMSREALRTLQFTRLSSTVSNVYHHVPFYRQLFDSHGVQPSVTVTGGFAEVSMQSRAMRKNYPLVCLPAAAEIVRYTLLPGRQETDGRAIPK